MSSKNVILRPPSKKPTTAKKTLASSTMLEETPCRKGMTFATSTKKVKQVPRSGFDFSFSSNASVLSDSHIDPKDGKGFDHLAKKWAYSEYLETLFLETLVDEKIKREETEFDLKMSELATRLEFNKVLYNKTESRLTEISFLSEQQRILDEKELLTENFAKELEKNECKEIMENLNEKEDLYCDRLHLKNVDIGYTEQNSYQQLLNAISEVSESLERIQSECNTELECMGPISKGFQECLAAEESIDKHLKDCTKILPEMSENVLEAVSTKLAQITM